MLVTTTELIRLLQSSPVELTKLEADLLERLIAAVDEIDALTEDLAKAKAEAADGSDA